MGIYGIGTTISFSNPGAGITQKFIPTKSLYFRNHNFRTGDLVTYSPGSGGTGTGDPYPGDNTASSPSNGWGHDGGTAPDSGAGAGGGGAGSNGVDSSNPSVTGKGGDGIQLRPEFHNPNHPDTIGAAGFAAGTPGNFFLAGGGGGGAYLVAPAPTGAGGGGNPTPQTPGAGGGHGGDNNNPYAGADGTAGTGGGGGGGGPTTPTRVGGDGGSGVVLIYYSTSG